MSGSLRDSLTTQLDTARFPSLFEEFARLIGSENWFRRSQRIREEVKGNVMLAPILQSENRIAIAFSELSQYKARFGRFPVPLVQSAAHYEACSFVVLFLDLHSRAPTNAKRALVRRVQGAFHNPDDLRALQFEWLIAVHLSKRGFALEFPELSGSGTIDIRALKDGEAMEVECKSISHNKGRRIHRREALELHSLFRKEFSGFTRGLAAGLAARVIIPDRLPTRHADRYKLCQRIRASILAGTGSKSDDLEVRVYDFDVQQSPLSTKALNADMTRTFLRQSFGIDNRESLILFSPGRRAFILSLESSKPDRLIEYVFDTIEDAVERQLSGSQAAIVCVKFEAMTSDELRELGSEIGDPTALRIATSKFLSTRRTSHLVCLSFFADGALVTLQGGVVTQEGRTYFFDNSGSPFYSAQAVSAFSEIS